MNGSLEQIQQWITWFSAWPWLLLAALLGPLIVLAAWKRIYPDVRVLVALVVPTALAVVLMFQPQVGLLIGLVDTLLVIMLVADALTLPSPRLMSAERSVMRIASLGAAHGVSLMVTNHSQRRIRGSVRDDVPEQFTVTPMEFAIELGPLERATMEYTFRAGRRGAFFLDGVHVRLQSRWRFWKRFFTLPCRSEIHVYPDMKQMAEYALLARTNRLSLMGVRRTRQIGQDNEFERLRDYTLDDNYKHIDWRSTARRRKLTVKQFQTNQSQRVVFLLDCGRMMVNQAAGLSLLDHALNAILMLSFVALRQGDAVGLVCFSNRVHTFIPPRGGMAQMNRLLHAAFDRFPQLVESRYDAAFLHLDHHFKKRSLVVLVTNLIDDVNAHQIQRHLTVAAGRHLPLGVLLRDRRVFDAVEGPRWGQQSLYRAAAAAEILTWRHQVFNDLKHHGVLALDVFPEEMTAPLVNRYLEIKARHLL